MYHEKKRILIIGGRDTSVEMLASLPIHVTLFQTADRLTDIQMKIAKRVIVTNLKDTQEVIQLAKAIHNIEPFDAAVSFLEVYLELTANIVETLKIKGNPLTPVRLTMDKYLMREKMVESDLPTVKFKRCRRKEDVVSAAEVFKFPIILKPTRGTASERVTLIGSASELDIAWEWANNDEDELIVEEYIDGKEYSIECLSHNGEHQLLAITEKETTGAPHFIESGHRQPAPIPEELETNIKNVVFRFLDLISQKEGPTHTELKVKDSIPYIIESHTRYGGDRIWEMVYLTKGLHIPQATVCQLLGLNVPIHPYLYHAAAVRFILSEPKQCQEITGVEQAKKQKGVYRVHLDVKPGDIIKPLASSDDRCGYILVGGDTPDEAITNASYAVNQICLV